MIKKFKKLLSAVSIAMLFALPVMPLAMVPVVHAAEAIGPGLNCGAELDASSIGGSTVTPCVSTSAKPPGEKVNDIIHLVINVFSLIVGVVSVIMIIIGGLKYITSGGDSGNITGAKNTILYAIIGLVVVALAQVVVRFVLEKTITP